MDTLFPTILILEIIILPLGMVGLFISIADACKAPSAKQARPSRLMSFVVPFPSHEIMKISIRFAQQTGYQICAIDPEHDFLTLGTGATFTSWGFFYPIYLSPQSDHSTRVEVGIMSKAVQIGPIVSRHHERCAAGIFAAIFAQI